MELTEQMAASDAFLRQRGLHCGNGGGEDVGLLEHLRGMWSIQRAEHSAVVELHALVQLDHRELVSAGFGAPVFVLQGRTYTQTDSEDKSIRPIVCLSRIINSCVTNSLMLMLWYLPPPSSPSGRRAQVPWPFSERPRG